MMNMDLGREMPDMSETAAPGEAGPEYPCLHIDGDAQLAELPDEGTMTVTFRKRSHSKSQDVAEGGEENHNVCLEITQILNVEAGEAEDSRVGDEREDELDKLAEDEVAKKQKAPADEGESPVTA